MAIKPNLALRLRHADTSGRLLVAEVSSIAAPAAKFQIINIYGPNQKNLGIVFFDSLFPVVDSSLHTVFCDDFNTTVDPVIDRRGCNPDSSWAYNWPRSAANFMTNFNLVDIWR